jgi:hypothetical protein
MTPATKQFNAAIFAFDEMTGFAYDRVTDLRAIAGLARLRGWNDIAQALLEFEESQSATIKNKIVVDTSGDSVKLIS